MMNPDMPSGQIEQLREELGLNQPLPVRYWNWLKAFLNGNWGYSILDGTPIKPLLITRIPRTLYLMGFSLLLAVAFGVVLGVVSALHQYSITDNILTLIGIIGISLPGFFIGMVLISVFALGLNILPTGGVGGGIGGGLGNMIPHMVLPGVALAYRTGSEILRFTRGSMLDALNRDYMVLAKSKGLTLRRVIYVHGLRTALIPVVTIILLRLPMLVGGSVIIEQVFNWPGMGTVLITSARGMDYPVVLVAALLVGMTLLFASLLADILLAIIDPRVRLG
jgi:peptide/nickel transport system permease protein